jgi:hypothetical protein
MATPITPVAEDLHEQDFYAWPRRQAELLRSGRYSDLDLAHLIEEVEDVARIKQLGRSRKWPGAPRNGRQQSHDH